jgi:hypothetical protein
MNTENTEKEQGPSDEEIKERLRACSDWGEPWDGWQHVIAQLRQGRLYYQARGDAEQLFPSRYPSGRKIKGLFLSCGFLEPRPRPRSV